MDRRSFLRSLGGAVAAAMLPFVKLPVTHLKEPTYYESLLDTIAALRRQRGPCDTIDIFTDRITAERIRGCYVKYINSQHDLAASSPNG